MTVLFWVLAVGALGSALVRLSATPAARAVPVSRRMAQARRIAAGQDREAGSVAFRR
jgi:hypothetical protein